MTRHNWRRVGTGKSYVTTAPTKRYGITIPAGFKFEVSVPNWMRWPIDPHDAAWLDASKWHDYALENRWWPIFASGLMCIVMLSAFAWWRWFWIPPTFLATLIVTTISPPLRRVFSWLKGKA
jgi:hypothetical protein